MIRQTSTAGFSLPELLVATSLLGVLSTVALVHAGPDRSRQQLDQAAQGLQLAIDRARLAAQRDQQACGLQLMPELGGAESAICSLAQPWPRHWRALGWLQGLRPTPISPRGCASASMACCLMAAWWCSANRAGAIAPAWWPACPSGSPGRAPMALIPRKSSTAGLACPGHDPAFPRSPPQEN